jgi:hypothetical protein
VRFKVLLDGKAWIPVGHAAHLYAHSAALGNRWGLSSELDVGEGEFRLPHGGLWRLDVTFEGSHQDVKAFRGIDAGGTGKSLPLLIETSFVFNMRP